MRKVQVLLVSMLMVFVLTGCGKKTPVGTWETTYDASTIIADYAATQGVSGIPTGLEVVMVMEFAEDGNYHFFMDEEASKASFDKWMKEYIEYSTDLLYKTYEETYGVTKEQADEEMKAQMGMTVSEFINSQLSTFSVSDMMGDGTEKRGIYTYTDTQIFIDGETEAQMDYVLDKKKLSVTFHVDGEVAPAGFPTTMEFTAR
ncbi:MAG: hypothetical protein MJ105_08850 [Lachnospiraceae bacterium]|nr:hypothetical protein [Lachnospiraceae bacterium]